MALKKATEAKAPEEESKAPAAPAAAEPVVETKVPDTAGEATQTPAEPVAPAAEPKPEAAAPVAEPEPEAAAPAAPAAEPEPEAAPSAEEEAEKPAFVVVANVRKTAFRQPSTGLWIQGGEVKHLANDGWLENHVNARLFELVED